MGKILVFGASVTYGIGDDQGGWTTRLRKYVDTEYNLTHERWIQIFNLSLSGEPIIFLRRFAEGELTRRIGRVTNNLIIYSLSTNDCDPANAATQRLTDPSAYKDALSDLVTMAQNHQTKVVVANIAPINEEKMIPKCRGLLTNSLVKEYNEYARIICQERRIPLLDFFGELTNSEYPSLLPDGVHPNPAGHAMLFETVKNFLNKNGLFEYCK